MIAVMVMILGALGPLGVWTILDARSLTTGSHGSSRGTRPRSSGAARSRAMALGIAAGVTVAGFSVSGWAIPSVAIGVIAAILGRTRGALGDRSDSDMLRVEALAGWVENLRDVLSAGDQPLGAIASTVTTCPGPIRPQVRRLAAGLRRQDPDAVVRRFADEIDDPIGDLIATGLLIAIRQGARTVGVLSALAEQARAHADRRRIIESERAPARREVQILTGIMGLLVAAVLILGRSEYLAAYDTASGQAFLTVALLGFGALILRVQQLSRFARPVRFLTAAGQSNRLSAPRAGEDTEWVR